MAVQVSTIPQDQKARFLRDTGTDLALEDDTTTAPLTADSLLRGMSESFALKLAAEHEQQSQMFEPIIWESTVIDFLTGTGPKTANALLHEYANLGKIEGREKRKQLWSRDLALAVPILLDRVKHDTDVARLAEASELLADMASPDVILNNLSQMDEQARPEYYDSLLRAIRWIEAPFGTKQELLLLQILNKLAHSNNVDIREIAYSAAVRLSHDRAVEFLTGCLQNEPDQEAREVISDALEELGT
jgi:hypothetical protein